MEKTFSSQNGGYIHVSVKPGRDSISFECDTSGSECFHTLKRSEYAMFIEQIGQPAGTKITDAIESVLESDPNTVWAAIHGEATSTEFTWMSMDDIEEMMDFFDSLRR